MHVDLLCVVHMNVETVVSVSQWLGEQLDIAFAVPALLPGKLQMTGLSAS
jgi:hypothetical protein